VVTAAGIIMASVFSGFILAPDTIIASIGFALAIGVLVDAFVVRMTLTPAVMLLLGKIAWYIPRWLDKVLPNVDIEGEKLLASLNGPAMAGRELVAVGAPGADGQHDPGSAHGVASGNGAAQVNAATSGNGAATGNGAVSTNGAASRNGARIPEGAHSVEAVGPEGREVFERIVATNQPR
jgi:hypothetical protein